VDAAKDSIIDRCSPSRAQRLAATVEIVGKLFDRPKVFDKPIGTAVK
jgi:hypothetical protein